MRNDMACYCISGSWVYAIPSRLRCTALRVVLFRLLGLTDVALNRFLVFLRLGCIADRLDLAVNHLTVFIDTGVIDAVDPSLVKQNEEDDIITETCESVHRIKGQGEADCTL
jgi:hypothetical protein